MGAPLMAASHDAGDFPDGQRKRVVRALLDPRPSREVKRGLLGGARIPGAFESVQRCAFSGIHFAHRTYLDNCKRSRQRRGSIINAIPAKWFYRTGQCSIIAPRLLASI